MLTHETEAGQLASRADFLASQCPVSGNDGYLLLDYYGLAKTEDYYATWDNYRGKKILDIGAGTSDFVARLLRLGADAYAFDHGYDDMAKLGKRMKGPLSRAFIDSVRSEPQRYISGSSHNLPFASGTFDAITSYYGIFGVIDDDVALAKVSINEAIRVLKPDGILSLGRLMDGDITQSQKANQRRLLDWLGDRNDISVWERTARKSGFFGQQKTHDMGKLTIIKES